MPLSFIGPSYKLPSRALGVQRTIGLIPFALESQNERTRWAFADFPGLLRAWTIGGGEVRGMWACYGRMFAVVGSSLYECLSNGTQTMIGSIGSSAGRVDMVNNTQALVIADGAYIYAWPFAGGSVVAVTTGGPRVAFLNQYLLTTDPDTERFKWCNVGNETIWDALDFASAEGSPDNLVGLIADHLDLKLGGTTSFETWVNTGTDAVFERDGGRYWEHGLAAAHTLQKLANTVLWLGSDERGSLAVFTDAGGAPKRVSTGDLEQKLTGIDVSQATAYTLTLGQFGLYCINVPGLDTTHVYEVGSGQWFELAELVNGDYTQHRARCHVYAFGKHYVGDANGNICELRGDVYTNDGDVKLRDRICPNDATPTRALQRFGAFSIDCDRGYGGQMLMRYSNDGGATWGSWRYVSLGAVGVRNQKAQALMCGAARDRVTQARVTDAVPWNPVQAVYA